MRSNDHNFIAKVDSGVSRNCISKSLWNRIKVNSRLTKPNVVLTGAGGSKLSLLGFSEITCSIGGFTFTEEFAVIEGMVSDMLLGIKWEHKFNIHTGWTRNGNHYISRGKHDFIAENMNRLKSNPIIKTKGRIELSPQSIALVEVQASRDIIGNKKYQLNPEGYLPQGIIPLDLVHSFDKMPLTAFTMHSGKFQWNVLPFGIGIGVQTFSFVINKAIGHCSDFAANYLDDIIELQRII